jgi:RNA recognition motif-containing protein
MFAPMSTPFESTVRGCASSSPPCEHLVSPDLMLGYKSDMFPLSISRSGSDTSSVAGCESRAKASVLQKGDLDDGGRSAGIHPNLFVRGIPPHWTEEQMVALFQKFGQLSSLRLVKHSVRKTSLGYGFVRYRVAPDACNAINALHGKIIEGHMLQVKLADSDAGPPLTSSVSGLTPCDTLYIKHVPTSFSKKHLEQLFGQYGEVIDVKEFPCLDQFRGSSALVKLDSVQSASAAIRNINGIKPEGWLHNIIVRYAESDKEKKERLARKEQQEKMKNVVQAVPAAPVVAAQALPDIPLNGSHQQDTLPSRGTSSSISGSETFNRVLVHNLPQEAGKLWLYEKFAKFGAILSLEVHMPSRLAAIDFAEMSSCVRAMLEMNQREGIIVRLSS